MCPPDSVLDFVLHVLAFFSWNIKQAGVQRASYWSLSSVSASRNRGNRRTMAKHLCYGDRYPAMLVCTTVSPWKSAGIWPLDALNEISPITFFKIICFCSRTDNPGPYSFKLDTLVWIRRCAAVPAHLSCTPTWISGAIRAAFHDPGVWFPHFTALCLPCALKEASVGPVHYIGYVLVLHTAVKAPTLKGRKAPSSTATSVRIETLPTTCKHFFSLISHFPHLPSYINSTSEHKISEGVLPGICSFVLSSAISLQRNTWKHINKYVLSGTLLLNQVQKNEASCRDPILVQNRTERMSSQHRGTGSSITSSPVWLLDLTSSTKCPLFPQHIKTKGPHLLSPGRKWRSL